MNIKATTADLHATALSIDAMRQIASQPEQATSQLWALLATLASGDEERVAWANDCLQEITSPAEEALPELYELCLSDCVPVASWACKLLGRFDGLAAECQDALVRSLREHPSTSVKQVAAAALAKFPKLSNSAQQVLAAATRANDPRLSRLATQALAAANR